MTQFVFGLMNTAFNINSSACQMQDENDEQVDSLSPMIMGSLIFGATALTTGLAAKFLFKKSDSSLKTKVTELVNDCTGNSSTEISKNIKAFIDKNWAQLSQGIPCFDQEKNKAALYEKLFQILLNKQPAEMKTTICQNVVKNFQTVNQRTYQRLQEDLSQSDFRQLFKINEGASIKSLVRLGEETHHKGDLPFLVEFSDGTKIVYKPRSMASEKAICAHENSYFARLKEQGRELGTYRILDRGNYGYCEFLSNRKEDNIFENKEELRSYAKHLVVLDLFSNEVRLTDQHNHNLAVQEKMPFTIDTEVVMGPKPKSSEMPFDTMILRWGNCVPGWFMDNGSINKIYWKEVKPQLSGKSQSGTVLCDFSKSDGSFFAKMIDEEVENCPPPTSKEKEIIEDCKTQLADQKHRIVMIDTQNLSGFIKKPLNETTQQEFLDFLNERMDMYGCQMEKSAYLPAWEKFKDDVMNNDVPVFYFHPTSGTVFYDDLPIGKLVS